MKKKKIVIATHGNLADGFVSSLNIIIGKVDYIQTICSYVTADFDLHEEVIELMTKFDPQREELLVFTDVFGGSVNTEFLRYVKQYPFHLVTNINLGLLMDVLLKLDENTVEETCSKVSQRDFSILYCNELTWQLDENIDDL